LEEVEFLANRFSVDAVVVHEVGRPGRNQSFTAVRSTRLGRHSLHNICYSHV